MTGFIGTDTACWENNLEAEKTSILVILPFSLYLSNRRAYIFTQDVLVLNLCSSLELRENSE